MPIFEYVCDRCKSTKDKLVTRVESEAGKTFECDCEEGATLRKSDIPTAATLRFKGQWFGTTGSY
jgi:predicted nucleic acid-binding Zn ribbon protein